jgi:hypothetical protein
LKIIKKVITISFYTLILFCVISFLSLSFSMIYSKFNNLSPNFTIGFPFEMYNQFEVSGKCDERTLLHGAHFINIVYNFIICFIVIALINYKQRTINNKQ